MEDVKAVSLAELGKAESAYIRPMRMKYTQNGVSKQWDLALNHPSVFVVIYNKDRDALVMVRQFRPAVFLSGMRQKAGYDDSRLDLSKIGWLLPQAKADYTASDAKYLRLLSIEYFD